MATTSTQEWVITTNPERCRDCYRCVRMCHVKAIRVDNGEAQIVPELCIGCGNCVAFCPQGAKSVRGDLPAVRLAISAGSTVVACLAPSAPAFFNMSSFDQMASTLKRLGFTDVCETTMGAEMVGSAYQEHIKQHSDLWPVIDATCPVVVNLVEKYYPDLILHLAPLISPVMAQGRILRQRYGAQAFIVFIGPCIARKEEARDGVFQGLFDGVLTFTELCGWLTAELLADGTSGLGVRPPRGGKPQLVTVEGGSIGTTGIDAGLAASHVISAYGLEACEEVLRGIRAGQVDACAANLAICSSGCAMDLALGTSAAGVTNQQSAGACASSQTPQRWPARPEWPELGRTFNNRQIPVPHYTEEQIQGVLHMVEKYTPEDELNCGACGYDTCRDKAAAALSGMAEATMCIPYMRRRSESLRQVVMDSTPNAILIVDERLYLHELSPSAERLLGCNRAACVGKPLANILPVTDALERVRDKGITIVGETVKLHDDLIVEQTIVPVRDHNLYMVILRDITERERQRAGLEHLRTEMLTRTQEVVNRQMRVAHEIAQLLGETTAESKMMLSRLASLIKGDEV